MIRLLEWAFMIYYTLSIALFFNFTVNHTEKAYARFEQYLDEFIDEPIMLYPAIIVLAALSPFFHNKVWLKYEPETNS